MSQTANAQATQPLSSPFMVPLNQLVKDPDNVRNIRSNDGIEALADNIHAEGLLQNLVVRKTKGGKYAVTGGERRRTALELLVKRKQMKATETIPCLLIEEAHTSASLSENIHRIAMHPADEFIAWAKMQDVGLKVEAIAKRHGVTPKMVEQRLKLGRLSPVVMDAFKTDEINLQTACAFAITDDHKQQKTVFEALNARGYNFNAHTVRQALTNDEIPSSNKLAKYVGRDAYETAGGEIRVDLFGEDVYFKNAGLLTKLAADKLEAEAKHLKAQGWHWIEVAFDHDYTAGDKMRTIRPLEIPLSTSDQKLKTSLEKRQETIEDAAENGDEQAIAEWDAIEAKLDHLHEKSLAYKPEDQAIAGGFISLKHDGSINIQTGYIRPDDDPQIAEAKRKKTEERANLPTQLTKSLRDDLSALRREIFQAAFLKNPAIARDLLTFHTIRGILTLGYTPSPFNLSASKVESAACVSKNGDMGQFKGRKNTERLIAKLPQDWLKIEDEIDSFEAFRALSEKDKTALQAYAACLMLEPQLKDSARAQPTLEQAAKLMSIDVASQWTPDADFFQRITKKHMEGIAEDVIDPAFVQRHAKDKKSDFAKAMGNAFDPKTKSLHLSEDAIKRMAAWVPDCMAV